jgi:hypothetical protein
MGGHLLKSLSPFNPSSLILRKATPPWGTDYPLSSRATLAFRAAPRTPSTRATPAFCAAFFVPRPASHPRRRSFQRGNRLPLAPLRCAPHLRSAPRLASRALRPPPRLASPCNPHYASRLEITRTQVHPSVAVIRPLVLSDSLSKESRILTFTHIFLQPPTITISHFILPKNCNSV